MKFTEKEAVDELKRQLKSIVGDPAINDKAIAETVATLLPMLADDDTELADFAVKLLPVLKTGDGNARKYASNAVKKREKELASSSADDGQAQQNNNAPTEPAAADNAAYAALMARIEALEEEKRIADKRNAAEQKRREIERAIETKGVKDKAWVDRLMSEVSVQEDADVEATAERYVKLYNSGLGETPSSVTPGAVGGEVNTAAMFADIAKMRKAREAAMGRGNTVQ